MTKQEAVKVLSTILERYEVPYTINEHSAVEGVLPGSWLIYFIQAGHHQRADVWKDNDHPQGYAEW